MQDIINDIIWTLFSFIIMTNVSHSIRGFIMKNELLILNVRVCNLKDEIDVLQKTKKSDLEISYLRLLIAKNQDRILTLLDS